MEVLYNFLKDSNSGCPGYGEHLFSKNPVYSETPKGTIPKNITDTIWGRKSVMSARKILKIVDNAFKNENLNIIEKEDVDDAHNLLSELNRNTDGFYNLFDIDDDDALSNISNELIIFLRLTTFILIKKMEYVSFVLF